MSLLQVIECGALLNFDTNYSELFEEKGNAIKFKHTPNLAAYLVKYTKIDNDLINKRAKLVNDTMNIVCKILYREVNA